MKGFGEATLRAIGETKYFYLRAGDEHRFVPVWVVVIEGRVLVRPWNDKATGWYRAFLRDGHGAIKVGARTVRVTARRVRSATIVQAMDAAYAEKYVTRANVPYVRGFATASRRAKTLELLPRPAIKKR